MFDSFIEISNNKTKILGVSIIFLTPIYIYTYIYCCKSKEGIKIS